MNLIHGTVGAAVVLLISIALLVVGAVSFGIVIFSDSLLAGRGDVALIGLISLLTSLVLSIGGLWFMNSEIRSKNAKQ